MLTHGNGHELANRCGNCTKRPAARRGQRRLVGTDGQDLQTCSQTCDLEVDVGSSTLDGCARHGGTSGGSTAATRPAWDGR